MSALTPLADLYRQEYGRLVAVLLHRFGLAEVTTAEDIASDTFLRAAEVWGSKGLPPAPVPWLYRVAGQRALDLLRRQATYRDKVVPTLDRTVATAEPPALDFSEYAIRDDQLRTIFVLCHPALPTDTQVALCLRLLCGFSVAEIAHAFLAEPATITKRLTRGKAKLRTGDLRLDLPAPDRLPERLEAVLQTLYLLFNEGYFSSGGDRVLRRRLCREALRLALLLVELPAADSPPTNGLLALMCYQSSRFDARTDEAGNAIPYDRQDRAAWSRPLIERGHFYLGRSGHDYRRIPHRFVLEAAIAAQHTRRDASETRWPLVLSLYNRLLAVHYTPVSALNRTYAYGRVHGPAAALREALKINLPEHAGYHLLLADLYRQLDDPQRRDHHYARAAELSPSEAVRRAVTQLAFPPSSMPLAAEAHRPAGPSEQRCSKPPARGTV